MTNQEIAREAIRRRREATQNGLPPVGSEVRVMTNCSDNRADKRFQCGTVIRHLGSPDPWLCEVEWQEGHQTKTGFFAREGMGR